MEAFDENGVSHLTPVVRLRETGMTAPSARPPWETLLLFAFGDFAFNLFWQSVTLFLLFHYTAVA